MMDEIEWFEVYQDDDEIVAAAGKINRLRGPQTRYSAWSWKAKLAWWTVFLCIACPWAAVFGVLGFILMIFPPFGVPLLGIAGAPGGMMMAWKMGPSK